VLAIVLGAANLKRAIGPDREPAANLPPIPRTQAEFEQQQRAALAALDTDGDGLDDFTELEWMRTSPFLSDSDSDGKTDKEEVEAGEDPNCPKGKTCGPVTQPEAVIRPTLPGLELPGGAPDLGHPPMTPGGGASDAVDPKALRTSLERQGISAAILDQLTDEQLIASYGTMLQTVGQLPSGAPSPASEALRSAFAGALGGNTSGSPSFLGQALPSTPPAVRQFLLAGGFPKQQLDQLDDGTMMRIWEQVVAKMNVRIPAAPTANP
jgi:hypothetical protein